MYRLDFMGEDNKKTSLVCKTEGAAVFHAIVQQYRCQRDPFECALKMPFMQILSRIGPVVVPIYPDITNIALVNGGHIAHLLDEDQARGGLWLIDDSYSMSKRLSDCRSYRIRVNYHCTGYEVTSKDVDPEDVSWMWF